METASTASYRLPNDSALGWPGKYACAIDYLVVLVFETDNSVPIDKIGLLPWNNLTVEIEESPGLRYC
jgi:hypothetical protein